MPSNFLEVVSSSLHDAELGLRALMNDKQKLQSIVAASEAMVRAVKAGGRLFSCGNGGSLCDAMHFAEELTGRFRGERKPIAATAIADSSHLTCVGNDYGYDHVFSRYLEAHARHGDVLLAISTSGSSKNILKAAEVAKSLGVSVVSLTGKDQCQLAALSDVHIATPAGQWSDRVQELHIKVIHILIELIEKQVAS